MDPLEKIKESLERLSMNRPNQYLTKTKKNPSIQELKASFSGWTKNERSSSHIESISFLFFVPIKTL